MSEKLERIGKEAFYWCKGLTSIYIPQSVTFIGNSAFQMCTNLQKVIVPNIAAWCSIKFGDSSVKAETSPLYMAKHLYIDDNTEITDLVIPDSVQTASSLAFRGWTALKSVTTPESMETLNIKFVECSNLKTVTIRSPKLIATDKGYEKGLSDYFGKQVTTYNISSETTKIGSYTFSHCSSVNSIRIPEKVTSIGEYAFAWNTSLEQMTIPENVITIANNVFMGCSIIKTITISEGVKSIGREAFKSCNELSKLIIPNSVEAIGSGAFDNSAWLNNQPEGVVYAGKIAYSYKGELQGLINLREDTHTIEESAFKDCKKISAISVPSSLKRIGKNAFYGCDKLEKVIITDIASWCGISYTSHYSESYLSNPLYYAQHLYSDENTEITELKIPEGVTNIGDIAFINCKSIVSVSFPNTLKTIGYMAFSYCDGLTSMEIPDGVTDIDVAFWGCTNLATVKLPTTLTNIASSAFKDCKSLNSINIPSNITSIGYYAFAGCESLKELVFPDSITSIGDNAFPTPTKLYVNRKSATLPAMWQAGYKPYLMGTENILEPPYLSVVSTTQTTATFKIENKYDDFNYSYGYTWNSTPITSDEVKVTNLYPETNTDFWVNITLGDSENSLCTLKTNYSTQPIAPTVNIENTASSIRATATYTKGDAEVTSQRLVLNPTRVSSSKIYGGTDVDGTSYTITGLDPQTSNTSFAYEIIVSNETGTRAYRTQIIVATTKTLKLTTQQPKVVSVGNVIVAAESNLDDEETNVGFEWRRTDWTDDFASNKGGAYLYEGVMEGYIRNLYTEKLWKYRPYYTSNSGKTYYGEWVGLDPTNTSYFEPTVHTYAKVDVSEGTATLNGYVMTGTDAITEQGFEYWTTDESSNAQRRAPQNVQTITATGQRMTATLTGLKDNTTYYYRAYVKTANNTTYGEERSFKTPVSTGIGQILMSGQPKTFNVYTLSGSLVRHQATTLEGLPHGIYIVNRKKVMVK